MIAQRTLALISYNDSNKDLLSRDYALANQLANYLQRNGIDAEIKGYSASRLDTDAHQWLILIPSPEIGESPQMSKIVDTALDQVVKRRMKGVLAITASTTDLPSKWATIRKYDASGPREESVALAGVLRAMKYAKVTYPEARALAQSQQEQQAAAFAASRQQKTSSAWFRFVLVAAVLVILVAAGGVAWFVINPSPSGSTLSPSKLTATAQARSHMHTAQTALTMTPQTSPTVESTAFVQARQKDYDTIMKKNPTITGFGVDAHWSTTTTDTTSCLFDKNNAYHSTIQTPDEYMRCMAASTKFTNFALQVMMTINGDAGGVIFRDNGNGTYYRLAFNQSGPAGIDTFSVHFCGKGACDTSTADVGIVDSGTPLPPSDTTVNEVRDISFPFTIIVRGGNIDLYLNNKFKIRVIDTTFKTSTPLSSQIGVFAASLGNPTDVTFSNLKVWSLD